MFIADSRSLGEEAAVPALREAERAFRTSLAIVEEKLEGEAAPGGLRGTSQSRGSFVSSRSCRFFTRSRAEPGADGDEDPALPQFGFGLRQPEGTSQVRPLHQEKHLPL